MTPPPVLFSAPTIAARVDELAGEIAATETLGARPLMMMVLLRGAFVFAADLARALNARGRDAEIAFLGLSSYGDERQSGGQVTVNLEQTADVAGRDVLVIDDVLDTGQTLAVARDRLSQGGAARVRTCVLLVKPLGRAAAVPADFVGFQAPDVFVVGYGMDVAGTQRGLAYIGTAPDAE